MEVVYVRPMHLGDYVVILNLLYNRAIYNQKPIQVYGSHMAKSLFDLFDYQGLEYMGDSSDRLNYAGSIISLMPNFSVGPIAKNTAVVPFLTAGMFDHIRDNRYKQIENIEFPKCKRTTPPKEDIITFQFDSRSLRVNKPPVDKLEGLKIIERHCNSSKLVGLGGPDTEPYLDCEFRLGNLEYILDNLRACTKFVGIDSGLSHLAGTVNVISDIIIIHTRESHYQDLVAFYHAMYPTVKCHRRPKCDKPPKLFL